MIPSHILVRRTYLLRLATIAITIGAGIGACSTIGAADPSTSKPRPPIAIHGLVEESKKLAEQAEKDDASCTQLYEQMKKSGPKPDAVGKLATAYKRLLRMGKRMMDLGEPAGAEFKARADHHRKEFEESFYAFGSRPEAPKFKNQAIVALQKTVAKRKKKADEIAKTAGSDLFAAEAMLDQGLDELELYAGILEATERGPFGEYLEVESRLRPMARLRREESVNIAATAYCAQVTGDLDAFVQEIQSAAVAIQKNSTTWRGQPVDSMVFLETMFREGFVLQSRLQKGIGYQHLIVQRRENDYGESSSGPPRGLDPVWATRLNGLKTELGKAAVVAIENDAKGVAPDAAPSRFALYATTLGKVAHRAGTDEWTTMFDNAIANASQRVSGAPKIAAYQQATNELLRWKERCTSKKEAVLIGKTPSLALTVGEGAKQTETEPGYIMTTVGGKPYPQFLNASFVALPLLGKRLGADPMVIARHVIHMDTEDPIWVSRWDNYIYARLPKKFLQSQSVRGLQKGLLVDDKHPALSVRASNAIFTAERGDGLTVAGTISEVFAEGAVTRIATLPDIAAPFVGLEHPVAMPREPATMTASLRAALKPKWYRHRYFIATVSSDSE